MARPSKKATSSSNGATSASYVGKSPFKLESKTQIMGRVWKSWPMKDYRRLCQHYDLPWKETHSKRDLAELLGPFAYTKGLSRETRLSILWGKLDEHIPWRYQEIDEEGMPKESAFPRKLGELTRGLEGVMLAVEKLHTTQDGLLKNQEAIWKYLGSLKNTPEPRSQT